MRALRLVIGNILVFVAIMLLIEGLASYFAVARNSMRVVNVAERVHTKYDPELGWVNEPGVYIEDMYGPGVYLRINSQGFRANHDFDAAVPEGKIRLICSGDSFTFGYGVDNDSTWCRLLSELAPRVETMNMGLGAYGTGQSFLSYRRDAASFEHQIQILAFITDDFYRMLAKRLYGYSKPVIEVVDGNLTVSNVPVPKPFSLGWRASVLKQHARGLRTTQALNRVFSSKRSATQKTPESAERNQQVREDRRSESIRIKLAKVLEELAELNRQRSSRLVLVYYPILQELDGSGPEVEADAWRAFVAETARSLGVPLIDMFPAFRSLPEQDRLAMFIPKGQIAYPASEGHFSRRGNEFAARLIVDALRSDPVLSQMISMDGPE